MQRTLPDLLRDTARRFPNHKALSFFGRTMTYRELDRESDKFCAFLRLIGLRPRDRVAMLLPNCPQMAVAFWGIEKAGCVMAALNPLLKSEELVEMVGLVKPGLLVTAQDFDAHNQALVSAFRPTMRFMMVSLADYLPPVKAMGYRVKNFFTKHNPTLDFGWWYIKELLRKRKDWAKEVIGEVPGPDDLAVLQFTGGTTGSVKAAMLSHANLVANAEQAMALVGDVVDENSVVGSIIPCFHVYGLSVCLVLAALRGAKVVMIPQFMEKKVVMEDGKKKTKKRLSKETLRVFREEKITLFPGMPEIFTALVNNMTLGEIWSLRSLKLAVSGSSALGPKVKEAFEAAVGCEIIEGYGLSETSPIVFINPPGRARPGSLGLPVPGTRVRIVPVPGIPPEDGGELQVQGPQVTQGYFNNLVATAEAFTSDGWFKTGDLVVVDEDGYFWFKGRIKEMIKVNGEQVHAHKIEEVLMKNLRVDEAYVVGVSDDQRQERVVACLVMKKGEPDCSIEQIREACGGLGSINVPAEVHCFSAEDIPRTPIGKVQKRELSKMLAKTPS